MKPATILAELSRHQPRDHLEFLVRMADPLPTDLMVGAETPWERGERIDAFVSERKKPIVEALERQPKVELLDPMPGTRDIHVAASARDLAAALRALPDGLGERVEVFENTPCFAIVGNG